MATTLLAGHSLALPAAAAGQAREIDSIFHDFGDASPGCAVGVQQRGVPVFAKGYGMADLEHNVPISPISMFNMASVSKQFTALTILRLVDEGKLRLRDPVRQYIPELPAYTNRITLYQLLTHTSGLRDYLILGDLAGLPDNYAFTEDRALRLIARQQRLNFEPGSEFLYSNSGYFLLSVVVRRVTGESLSSVARRKLFTPLSMEHTLFQDDHTALVANKAFGYERRSDAWHAANSPLDTVGDGGLYSSVDEMFRWMRNLETTTVGGDELRLMKDPAKLNGGQTTDYGMGLESATYRGLEVISHGGGLAGYRTEGMWFPSAKLAVVVLCNARSADPEALASKVADVYLPLNASPSVQSAGAPRKVTAINPVDLQKKAGYFYSPGVGAIELTVDAGQLFFGDSSRRFGAPWRRLAQIKNDVLVFADAPAGSRFVFNNTNGVQDFDMLSNEGPAIHFERLIPAPTSDEIRNAYIGQYVSPELDTSFRIIARGSDLSIVRDDNVTGKLLLIDGDRVIQLPNDFVLEFGRDASGKVSGFKLNAGSVRGIEVKKVS